MGQEKGNNKKVQKSPWGSRRGEEPGAGGARCWSRDQPGRGPRRSRGREEPWWSFGRRHPRNERWRQTVHSKWDIVKTIMAASAQN